MFIINSGSLTRSRITSRTSSLVGNGMVLLLQFVVRIGGYSGCSIQTAPSLICTA